MDKSLYRNGVAVSKRDTAIVEADAAERRAAVVAANRERLRMDEPAVDATRLEGARAVFVRGRGWFFVKSVNERTVTAFQVGTVGFERIPFSKVVDVL